MRNTLKKYICIKQHDIKDCSAACLATISKQYGLKIPISKIREVAGTDKQGTSAFGIIKAAEQLGVSAKGVKVSKPEDFFEIWAGVLILMVKSAEFKKGGETKGLFSSIS